MAKRRKNKKYSPRRKASAAPHRRRRIGARSTGLSLKMTATNPLFKIGSIALGFFMPDLLPINKLVGDKMDPKLVAGAEAGLGFLLAMKKGQKSLPLTIVGGYLLGAGLKKGLVALGVMSGVGPYGRVPVIGNRVNGPYGNMPVIGRRPGFSPNHALNGGFTPNGTLYTPKIMSGVGDGGSGYTSTNKGSGYMD